MDAHRLHSVARKYKVFVSHGGEDTFVVDRLIRPLLASSGADVFVDAGKIQFGDDFRNILVDELSLFDELLVLITKSALERPWVLAEIGAAIVRKKRVVAMVYGVTDMQLQSLGIISLLGTNHLLKLDDVEKYVEELTQRVRQYQ